jgi:ribonuclease T1
VALLHFQSLSQKFSLFEDTAGTQSKKVALFQNAMTILMSAFTAFGPCSLTAVQAQSAVSVEAATQDSRLGQISYNDLPREAASVHEKVSAGGPFPFAKDATVFGNRERILPRHATGYYREYTVKTPGSRDRGARRIVCGGVQPTQPKVCYYTADHYSSFKRIVH